MGPPGSRSPFPDKHGGVTAIDGTHHDLERPAVRGHRHRALGARTTAAEERFRCRSCADRRTLRSCALRSTTIGDHLDGRRCEEEHMVAPDEAAAVAVLLAFLRETLPTDGKPRLPRCGAGGPHARTRTIPGRGDDPPRGRRACRLLLPDPLGSRRDPVDGQLIDLPGAGELFRSLIAGSAPTATVRASEEVEYFPAGSGRGHEGVRDGGSISFVQASLRLSQSLDTDGRSSTRRSNTPTTRRAPWPPRASCRPASVRSSAAGLMRRRWDA